MKQVKAYEYIEMENPVYEKANDPWVIRHEDRYYYCWSEDGICIREIDNLNDIKSKDGTKVWEPPAGTMYSAEIWAPELHYLNGEWYIYFAASNGANKNHRMYVLKGTSQDPTDPFEFVGQITDPTDRWAIDGTVMQYQGELYFVWSGWKGSLNTGQQTYIAHMSDPTTIDSERVRISAPKYTWEMIGLPIQEGQVALTDEETGTAIIVYSASGSWTDHYCLGQLTLTGTDPMDPKSWTKNPRPIFSKAEGAYGPGHCSFTEAHDGQLWIVYHANTEKGTGWEGRTCRTQPVFWDGKTLDLGIPAKVGEKIKLPIYNTLTKKQAEKAVAAYCNKQGYQFWYSTEIRKDGNYNIWVHYGTGAQGKYVVNRKTGKVNIYEPYGFPGIKPEKTGSFSALKYL